MTAAQWLPPPLESTDDALPPHALPPHALPLAALLLVSLPSLTGAIPPPIPPPEPDFSAEPPIVRRPDVLVADFEQDTFGDWTVVGTAFGDGPVSGTPPGRTLVDGFGAPGTSPAGEARTTQPAP